MKRPTIAENLVRKRLERASLYLPTGDRATAAAIIKESRAPRKLGESEGGKALERSFEQFFKSGNTYRPTGAGQLTDSLEACPYRICRDMAGIYFERVKPNTDEVIRFNDSNLDKVVQEVDRFWNRKESYENLKIMHNRGILLYGPPGTGKSICLQQVVESMVNRGDLVFFADSPDTIQAGMEAFRQVEPTRKVVVAFEEAEDMVRYGERTLLRLMDGDSKVGGVLYLATTNYIDQMPPRMLRSGRFDKKIYVGYPTLEQRLQYLTHKIGKVEKDPKEIQKLAEESVNFGFADLRELIAGIYAIGDDRDSVISRLKNPQIVR